MTDVQPLYSLSICAQVTLNLHSLNNEGGEGNQIQTRMVNVIGADGQMHNVNGISGDMFKHIQAEHLHRLALEAQLPLSEGARTFNANRVNFDIDAKNELQVALNEASSNAAELDVILQRCAVTDLEGILVTAEKRSLPRKSVVEFGWVSGIPNRVETDTFFHAKYVSDRSVEARQHSKTDEGRETNIGQSIFHRPASSGVYAVVLNIETARVGFNDISQQYAIEDTERMARLKVLLESVMYTFIEPAGAMRSTQNPHIVDMTGVVTVSRNITPAPCISPLKPAFVDDVKKVAMALNMLRKDAIEVIAFDSMGEFAMVMAELIQTAQPYTLAVAQQQ